MDPQIRGFHRQSTSSKLVRDLVQVFTIILWKKIVQTSQIKEIHECEIKESDRAMK